MPRTSCGEGLDEMYVQAGSDESILSMYASVESPEQRSNWSPVMLKNQDFLCIRSFICTSMTVHRLHAARVVSTAWFLPVVTNAEEQNHRIIKWPSPVRLIADHVAVSFFSCSQRPQ
jgi:hypothetical protein